MVLDSSPVCAIFFQEEGSEALRAKIESADRVLIGAPTLLEIAIVLSQRSQADPTAKLRAFIDAIGAEVIEFSELHHQVALEAYLRFGRGRNTKAKLNFGDCMSYAVAKVAQDSLL